MLKCKILSGLCLALCAYCASAAYQYNPVYEGTFGKNGGYFTFDSNTSLVMDVWTHHTGTNPLFQVVDFGYYNIGDNKLFSNQNGVLGPFTANDKIGIWIENHKGEIFTSTYVPGLTFGAAASNGYNEFSIYTGEATNHNIPSHYDYKLSGQPLPGVLATLLAGGAASVGFANKRKRKNML